MSTIVWTFGVLVSFPICLAIIFFTIVNNIFVIHSVLTYPSLKSCENLLLVSLAIADISNAIFVMPLDFCWRVIGPWPFNTEICFIHLTSDSYLCTTSIMNLVAIAMDRYWAITDPISHTYRRTKNFIISLAATAWSVAFAITILPLAVLSLFDVFRWPKNDCYYPRGYILYVTFAQFVFPLFAMTIIYCLIYKEVKEQIETIKGRCEMFTKIGKESEPRLKPDIEIKQKNRMLSDAFKIESERWQ
ncbi:G protein-coupled receptor-like protein, partial [Dinothrombium tinctorium]